MMSGWWADDERMMSGWWADDEQMMSRWWADDERMMSGWWADYEHKVGFCWKGDEKSHCWHSPALQMTLQPENPIKVSVLNKRLTTLLLLFIAGGREDPIGLPPTTTLEEEFPQLFSIKVEPSPSMIVRWSLSQVGWCSMSNAVNCNEMTSPSLTSIVSVLWRLFGYLSG